MSSNQDTSVNLWKIIQSRYIGDIYLHKKSSHKAFLSHGWQQCRGWLMIFPGYCFKVRAQWLEERKSEIRTILRSEICCNTTINTKIIKIISQPLHWMDLIYYNIHGLILTLPSASDILQYILSCRASAIYGLPINLQYIYKRVSPLVTMHITWLALSSVSCLKVSLLVCINLIVYYYY